MISRELIRNSDLRGYRQSQAYLPAEYRALNRRNIRQIADSDWLCVEDCLRDHWSPEQIASEVSMSHETIYRHVYTDKSMGSDLYESLRCQRKRRKGYADHRERRGHIPGGRPICDRAGHMEARCQIGDR